MCAGHFVRMCDGHWPTSKALRMLSLSTLSFWEPFKLHWFIYVYLWCLCVWRQVWHCAHGSQRIAGILFHSLGPGDWTQIVSLGDSSFTQWATSPVPHFSFIPFFQEDSEGSGELSGHGQGSTFNSIWWRIPSVVVPSWGQKTSKWLSCGLKELLSWWQGKVTHGKVVFPRHWSSLGVGDGTYKTGC